MQKYNLLRGYHKYYSMSLHHLFHNHYSLLQSYLQVMGFTHTHALISRTFIAKTILGDNYNSAIFSNCAHNISLSHNFMIVFTYTGILLLNLHTHHFLKHLTCRNIFIPNSQIDSASILFSSKLSNTVRISTDLGELSLKVIPLSKNITSSIHLLILPYQVAQMSGDILKLNTNTHYAQSFQHINEYLTQVNKQNDALASYAMPVMMPHYQVALLCLMNRDLIICKLSLYKHIGYFFADNNIIIPAKIRKRIYYVKSAHMLVIQTTTRLIYLYLHSTDFNFCDSKANNSIDTPAINYRNNSRKHIFHYLQHNGHSISKSQFHHLKSQF